MTVFASDEGSLNHDFQAILESCRSILAQRPAGLLTDIDGTISQIAPTPDSATVSDVARQALASLAARLEVVAAITGRAAENAEHMLAVPRMTYVGNHGLEFRHHGITEINKSAVPASSAVAKALDMIEQRVRTAGQFDGILYENKGVTGSIHYRLASNHEMARAHLMPLVETAAAACGLRTSEGRMVIELRPRSPINKGTAVGELVERNRLRGVLFFGDDVTDIDGFYAIRQLRSNGAVSGLAIAVTAPDSSPEVAAAADVAIPGVTSCIDLLVALAGDLRGDEHEPIEE